MLRISIVADRQNDYKHLDMFFGGRGRELEIQQLYFNTCRGHTFIYPCLGEVIAIMTLHYVILLWVYFCLPVFRGGGDIATVTVTVTVTVTATATATVTVTVTATATATATTILRYTIRLRVYFCLPTFRGGEGGYCNCNCDCDCNYYSTIYNSVAGILLPTRV